MSPTRRSLGLTGLLAAGSTPLLLALALHGQPVPRTQPHPNSASLNVAHLLDGLAQNRFQDTTMVVFGMSRISPQPAYRQHPSFQLSPKNPHETAVMKAVDDARKDYVVSFLHCAPVPDAQPVQPLILRLPL